MAMVCHKIFRLAMVYHKKELINEERNKREQKVWQAATNVAQNSSDDILGFGAYGLWRLLTCDCLATSMASLLAILRHPKRI